MNTPLLVREVALRLAAAVIGYFVIFSAYLFLFAAHAKHLLGISVLLKVSATTLALPFIELKHNPVLLAQLLRAPKVDPSHTFHAEIVRTLILGIGLEAALFVLLAAVIVAFERTQKTLISTIFFYACMPALLWLLWSQLYLFIA
ncbi:MAG: hypothetical protein JWN49_386 [Parcubacteria group bacterium]|nr:hypothetical protein [Parcubacteria group bacterium]